MKRVLAALSFAFCHLALSSIAAQTVVSDYLPGVTPEGFVYFFSEGNGDESCERLRIQEGDLNEGVKVTYHDYGNTWDNYLHFKWKRQPDHLILVDHNRFEWDYYATDLTDALRIKAGKRISDY